MEGILSKALSSWIDDHISLSVTRRETLGWLCRRDAGGGDDEPVAACAALAHVAKDLLTGEKMILKGAWRLGQKEVNASPPVRIVMMRLESGELLALATDRKAHTRLVSVKNRS